MCLEGHSSGFFGFYDGASGSPRVLIRLIGLNGFRSRALCAFAFVGAARISYRGRGVALTVLIGLQGAMVIVGFRNQGFTELC